MATRTNCQYTYSCRLLSSQQESPALTCDLTHVFAGNAHDVHACIHLLRNEGPRWGHEDDLSRGVPPVEVVHHDCRDERLSQACVLEVIMELG